MNSDTASGKIGRFFDFVICLRLLANPGSLFSVLNYAASPGSIADIYLSPA